MTAGEHIGDAFVSDQPFCGHANLALPKRRRHYRFVEIRIVQYEQGRFPAEFEQGGLQISRGEFRNMSTNSCRSREIDAADGGMRD
jgi:hypothetical protein